MVHHQEGWTDGKESDATRARSEDETIATIIYMVNRGVVRLCGTFKGARFDLRTLAAA